MHFDCSVLVEDPFTLDHLLDEKSKPIGLLDADSSLSIGRQTIFLTTTLLSGMPSANSHDMSSTQKPSSLFKISLGAKPKVHATAPHAAKKRPYSDLQDGSESDNDAQNHDPQLISSFDDTAGGAIAVHAPKRAKSLLVIPSQSNRDWKEEAARKKGRNLLPAEEQARRDGGLSDANERKDGNPDERPVYGLVVAERQHNDTDGISEAEKKQSETVQGVSARQPAGVDFKARTVDDEAMEALLGDGKKKSTLLISSSNHSDGQTAPQPTEDDAFRCDVASRPDPSSVSDYAAVPVEEFGEAMLRGMGWKEGEVLGRKKGTAAPPKDLQRRPALLGIGAKKVPEGLEELGAWGKGAKKSGKIEEGYSPMVLKNARTGEILTEEELNAKRDRGNYPKEELREKKDSRSLAKVERRHRDKGLEHRNDSHTTSSRHGSSSPRRRINLDQNEDDVFWRSNRDRDRMRDDERSSGRWSPHGGQRRQDRIHQQRDREHRYRDDDKDERASGRRHKERGHKRDLDENLSGSRHDSYV